MTRRAAVEGMIGMGLGTGIARPASGKIIKPPVLKPGDTAGIVSPSTQVTDPDRLELAAKTLDYFGLKAKWGASVRTHRAQGVATVAERVDDLHAMFRDPDVRMVFCIRGGYGAGQLLADLDYSLIASNPKIFIGYSDITALHLGIHQMTGLVTFHGPVVLSEFTPYTQDCFRRALFSKEPLGALGNPPESNPLRPAHRLRTIRGGRASGPLMGGNLTLISTLMGTPFEIDTKDKLFFTEDVGEEPYRIDRMLTQLRLAGKLNTAAGIVMGECLDCRPNDYKPSFAWNLTFGEVLDDRFQGVTAPVLSGLTIGHTADQLTLPLGIQSTLDADKGQLIVEEPATI
ncbi:MAG TPA: LD-carboxypeptidase [Candidatus Sulfotelmatobacter sp.]|nr:LD-carboxypeptidase [Candidatus Sulfotelmatobacter sp.]